jgi:hypothetical protein
VDLYLEQESIAQLMVGSIHYGGEQLPYYDRRVAARRRKAEMNLGSAGLTACATVK